MLKNRANWSWGDNLELFKNWPSSPVIYRLNKNKGIPVNCLHFVSFTKALSTTGNIGGFFAPGGNGNPSGTSETSGSLFTIDGSGSAKTVTRWFFVFFHLWWISWQLWHIESLQSSQNATTSWVPSQSQKPGWDSGGYKKKICSSIQMMSAFVKKGHFNLKHQTNLRTTVQCSSMHKCCPKTWF